MASLPQPENRIETKAPLSAVKQRVSESIILPVLDLVGDQWTLRILRELLYGNHRFAGLQGELGIARSTLSSRLDDLVHHALVERRRYRDAPPRFEYRLTERGRDFHPLIFAIERWDRSWGLGPADAHQPVHAACGAPFEQTIVCGACGGQVRARDVTYRPGPGAGRPAPSFQRRPRRRSGTADPEPPMAATDILGDRWTALVLAAAWFGLRRFSDIEAALDIAPNILSRRLAHLEERGIFARHLYQRRPPRYTYILTEKGFDLYPMTLSLIRWGDRWIAGELGPPLILEHRSCGAVLDLHVHCRACDGPATLDDLRGVAP